MKFISLGSGSSGNCYYIANDSEAILVDAGVGIRRIKRHMKEYGISSSNIKGVLLTHDHADHVKAAGHISNEFGLPIYATKLVHNGLQHNHHSQKKIATEKAIVIDKEVEFTLAGFHITAFVIPHDASENVGYIIRHGNNSFTIMTDVGAPTDTVKHYIMQSNHLVIEANYDEEMLRHVGKYPKELQDRITSGTGHLSNIQTAKALVDSFHPDLHNVFLCHLSEENNHPELARKTIECHLRSFGIIAGKDFQLEVLRRTLPTGPFDLYNE